MPETTADKTYGIVIHGGAGTLTRAALSEDTEAAIRRDLEHALAAGMALLREGGSSLDAVEAAVVHLEDSPLFNAGRGAVYTSEETHELDASIMDGASMKAGAVAAVRTVRNPIRAARRVMDASPHVMLVGDGAEAFAHAEGLERVENSYFNTEHRLEQLERARRSSDKQAMLNPLDVEKYGTVGAVALDQDGNLAAATSTGGTTNKRFGRVGDSPIVGAGTYADNEAGCAISATGHGEFFIRFAVAHDICARKRYSGITLAEASDQVVMQRLVDVGGSGGVIAIDRRGNIVMPFNTEGMYRGYALAGGESVTAIFKDE